MTLDALSIVVGLVAMQEPDAFQAIRHVMLTAAETAQGERPIGQQPVGQFSNSLRENLGA